ncbi:hypothetical protein ACJMK2_034198 [Sinanodonta woodiana]|uniref:RING-type E3 ubiquitin transferase n=2 Tax=Sinanodonta woodiana TaxID=1069815 RepID=A0ABD3WUA1_SINWO
MASYFDEHDCQPLGDGQQPDHMLHLARLMLDTGIGVEWNMEFERLTGEKRKVPASKKVIEELPTTIITPVEAALEKKCPICLGLQDEDDEVKRLPCSHKFHTQCILPWLSKVNTCPLCRHELPTDDPDYEAYRKQKARAKQREFELDSLHGSMFG